MKGKCRKHYNAAYMAKYRERAAPALTRAKQKYLSSAKGSAAKSAYDKTYYKNNRAVIVERNYAAALSSKYGLTVEQHTQMLRRQRGRCAICRRKPKRRLQVDHCHTSGKVRGLLCSYCNRSLGAFERNENWLTSALKYLAK